MPPLRSIFRTTATVVCLTLAGGGPARGQTAAPYAVDSHTLHLWHFDESGPPFSDQARPGLPLLGLQNGAAAGQPSLPGLGTCLSFHANAGGKPGKSDLHGAILTAAPQLAVGGADNVPADFRYFGTDGAFTFEAVVHLNQRPQDAQVIALGLISMDGEGSDRIFNFRIEKEGFLAFIPLPDCGATGGGIATIPTSGPHALDTEGWFHVAVSYDGNPGVASNLKLYWTRLGPGVTEANLIGSGTLSSNLNGLTGDFAIGNEARSYDGNGEAEPFPGLIDEVRISGVARHPTDFFFVPLELRQAPEHRPPSGDRPPPLLSLRLAGVLVDSVPTPVTDPLKLGSGLHRLDFDFGIAPGQDPDDPFPNLRETIQLRCQLEGVDERWQETQRGMSLTFQALDAAGTILSQSRFPAVGRSDRWETSLEDSPFTPRREPVFIPAGAASLRLILSSGLPDTTGNLLIDNIALTAPQGGDSCWENGNLSEGVNVTSLAGLPTGWHRGGSDFARARVIIQRPGAPAIGLMDGDQLKYGEWISDQPIQGKGLGGRTMVLSWDEAYNVIGGTLHRATYLNVPPGHYTFRAIGLAEVSRIAGDGISLPIVIAPPFWQRLWFWPGVAAGGVALIATAAFRHLRRRSRRRLDLLKFQNALERDRTRIARDMHDDLGTRITVLNMTASLARRNLDHDPEKARNHLDKITHSARELVTAMDELVWAVDPSHDTLDHLASHLTRMADEIFRDSPVRCRLDIPPLLPALPLNADYRHHLALAVKESLHNVLQHAGPCEVHLSLALAGRILTLTIRDTGRGFDPANDPEGHGCGNLRQRAGEIGGTCRIDSSPGAGTCIVLTCPLPERPR